ncbi:MAG: glycosyltransferase family 8 protein [Bacteroidia bacterium]
MNIVCSTDNNFVQHCCIMLTSVLVNNDNVTVFLLTEGLTKSNIEILRSEIESKNGIFEYIIVENSIFSRLPMPNDSKLTHITVATYYRLLVSDILPKNIEKVIYLDCDIIVRKSLKDLWNTEISDYAIGSVHQMTEEVISAQRLDYPNKYGYFNAGVLLINMSYWRKFNIPEKLINYIVENSNKIVYHDQDALNAVLYNQSFALPCKWNMIYFFFLKDAFKITEVHDTKLIEEYRTMLVYELNDPTVIHFVSKPKPWQRYCIHRYRNEYYKFATLTIYFNNISKPNPILDFLHLIFLRIINLMAFIKHFLLKTLKLK